MAGATRSPALAMEVHRTMEERPSAVALRSAGRPSEAAGSESAVLCLGPHHARQVGRADGAEAIPARGAASYSVRDCGPEVATELRAEQTADRASGHVLAVLRTSYAEHGDKWRALMREKQHVYDVWREAVTAMEERGSDRYSREALEHQQQVLKFADMRKRWSPLKIHRAGESWREKAWRVLARLFVVGALGAALYFGCHVEWFAAVVLAVFGESILRKLTFILWYVYRSLEVNVYMLARMNAERGRLDIYAARSHIEYMHHPEIPFEKALLEHDLYGFGYQVSDECLGGKCQKCNGAIGEVPCLHKCHKRSES